MLVRGGALTDDGYARLEAERTHLLESGRDRILRRHPGLTVTLRLAPTDPGHALVEAGEEAGMVVVGARGIGGFDRLLLGSVSLHTAAHARCPVVIIPVGHRPSDDRRIVLGVDEVHAARAATGWAFAEADRRGVPLVALHGVDGFGAPGQRVGELTELAEALAGWTPEYPDLKVTHEASPAGAARALIEASEHAALVVVGARRRRSGIGMALGRVNHAVIHHARCPVAIVPEQDS